LSCRKVLADQAAGACLPGGMSRQTFLPGRAKVADAHAAEAVRQREAEVVNAGFHAVYTIAGRTSVPNTGRAEVGAHRHQ
jgi:hypothetical protein